MILPAPVEGAVQVNDSSYTPAVVAVMAAVCSTILNPERGVMATCAGNPLHVPACVWETPVPFTDVNWKPNLGLDDEFVPCILMVYVKPGT